MRTWRLATSERRCGDCRHTIATGAKFLEIRTQAYVFIRCQPCGEQTFGEAAPDVVENPPEDPAPSVEGLTFQPSLGFNRGER